MLNNYPGLASQARQDTNMPPVFFSNSSQHPQTLSGAFWFSLGLHVQFFPDLCVLLEKARRHVGKEGNDFLQPCCLVATREPEAPT